MTAAAFEQVVRTALAERDRRRRARLLDREEYARADSACVSTILEAAGLGPLETPQQATRRRRRAAVEARYATSGPDPDAA